MTTGAPFHRCEIRSNHCGWVPIYMYLFLRSELTDGGIDDGHVLALPLRPERPMVLGIASIDIGAVHALLDRLFKRTPTHVQLEMLADSLARALLVTGKGLDS